MSKPEPPYIPQSPPRDWVVTKTGHLYQRRLPEKPAPEAAKAPAKTSD